MDNFPPSFHVPSIVVAPDTLSIVAGCFVFGTSMAVSTFAQGKLLGVSTGSVRPIPSVLGIVTVCAASLISHRASIMVHQATSSSYSGKYKPRPSVDTLSIGNLHVSKQAVRM
jgi:hypothetical protein